MIVQSEGQRERELWAVIENEKGKAIKEMDGARFRENEDYGFREERKKNKRRGVQVG
jgi:hypothetical protein